jgi:hypothetical protein
MYKSNLHEVIKAIEACHENYRAYKMRADTRRSDNRQWDSISRICTGCGDPLRQYDNQKGHAFCYSCREALFPETVNLHKLYDNRFNHFRLRGHFR